MGYCVDRFTKAFKVGRGELGDVWVEIEWVDGKLSFAKRRPPVWSGRARGGCGQVVDDVRPFDLELADIWDRWHLNHMRAGCEHQRAEGWNKRPIDSSKPLSSYGRHFDGQRAPTWNMLTWILREEHPAGLLAEPCPTCGYRYGTAWLFEPVPEDVIEYLAGLPDQREEYPWR